MSYTQIAEQVTRESGTHVTKDMVQKWVWRATPHPPKAKSTNEIREYLQTNSLSIKPATHVGSYRKVLAIGDLHGKPGLWVLPFVQDYKPHIIVIGGDIFDQALFSVHAATPDEKREELLTEIRTVRAWLELILLNTGAEVKIMRGNHDDRFMHRVLELLPYQVRFLVNDPLEVLIKDLPRVELVCTELTAHRPTTIEDLGSSRYLYPIGDALISHANFLSTEKLSGWYDHWHQTLGLEEMALLVQFHTHQWNHRIVKGGWQHWVEPGMAGESSIEGYKVAGHQAKWKPGTLGCLTFEQDLRFDKWITQLDTIKPVSF
jgi:hypothetical protein